MNIFGLMFAVVFLSVGFVVFLLVLRVTAAVTRTAVRMANGTLGGREVGEFDYLRGGGSQYDVMPRPKSLAGIRVPVPGVGYAILLNFLAGVVALVVQVGVAVVVVLALAPNLEELKAAKPGTLPESWQTFLLVNQAAGTLAGFLTGVAVFKYALPTTFVRAGFVVFYQYLICAVLGLGLFLLVFGTAGGLPTVPGGGGGGTVWFK